MNLFTSFTKTFLLSLTLVIGLVSLPAEAQRTRPRPVAKKPVANPTTPPNTLPEFTPSSAVEHGYAAGYNDGYISGRTDYNTNTPKDFQRSTLYQEAKQGYERQHGNLTEYQRGYKAAYEIGYNDGYVGREKNARMPTNLNTTSPAPVRTTATTTAPAPNPVGNRSRAAARPRMSIPVDTVVRLRLESEISTKTNQEGDKFTAFLVEPQEYEGAIIEGHIAKVKRAGKLTGQTELALEFDRITFRDGTATEFRAQVERIFATEKVKTIDEEGNVQTGSTTRDTTIRSAGGGALGAIIGGIAGGGKGAAIGAILGATVGAGSVYVEGNKDLVFDPGTEIQVRTIGPRR
jgi:hypothetical protein